MDPADRDAVVRCVRGAEVDILIDLGGYGDRGMLLACARRIAPVQIKWVGAQNHTTGLDEMDWFITDRWETPAGFENLYTERLLRMPDGYVCYSPPIYAPDIAPSPALATGRVTFGSFNNLAKITPDALSTWSRVLRQVHDARLVLKAHAFSDAATRDEVRARFVATGIEAERIELRGGSSHRSLLGEYRDIDIALDPFPYSGGLTTCEALWMGVPTVSLPGETFSSRHSTSHMSNVGLGDWVAGDLAEYEAIAVARAKDPTALSVLRGELRSRVRASPLCDAPRFGSGLAAALRAAWQDWCRAQIANA
jgi:predicted O-linked N-acetylglucosamine transferase (SPINDLY family)